MDINELYTAEAHEAGVDVQLVNPKGEPIDAYIKFVGPDSKTYRDAMKWMDTGAMLVQAGVKGVNIDDYSDAKFYAKLSLDWRGLESDGKDVKYSKDNVEKLLDNAPYQVGVIKKTIAKRENFIKG